ncbi:hypothetical protein [Peristeroidobacter soli]|uniref:hypothetical protein n=1 Tax=Peristeroidobacter soli TaxID=2497877 RepID=UPI00101D5E79|nr:hypothetical protein [Peristeroidobacter soli]
MPRCVRRAAACVQQRHARSQIEALLDRLASRQASAAGLAADLRKLSEAKQQWALSDPQFSEEAFGDLLRTVLERQWPGKKVLHLEKALHERCLAAAGDSVPEELRPLRDQLSALITTQADSSRAVEGLKAKHRNELQKMGFGTARQIAAGILWKGPVLSAALKAFDQANKACEFKPGATEAQLRAARDELEHAGDNLLDALDRTHPKLAPAALSARYSATANWRAVHIQPKNQAQADLYNRFVEGHNFDTSPGKALVLDKSRQAKALLREVAEHNTQRQPGTPRTAEEQYFRELSRQRRYLERVDDLDSAADDPDMKEFQALLAQLPTSPQGARRDPGEAAPDYAKALETLQLTVEAADQKVAMLIADTVEQIAQLERESSITQRAKQARQLVQRTSLAVLMKLPVREQLILLRQVRGHLRGQPPNDPRWRPFLDAQSKLYRAMQLSPAFLRHEKEQRRTLMSWLQRDKKMLREARDLWHTYTPGQMRDIMMKIAQAHSRALNCEPPQDIRFTTDPDVKGYRWLRDQRVILVGTVNRQFLDFEDMIAGLCHENSHNWQDQLAKQVQEEHPVSQEDHPLHEQALSFAANHGFYIRANTDYLAYRSQPVEAHAFRTGAKFSADLMRMLAS